MADVKAFFLCLLIPYQATSDKFMSKTWTPCFSEALIGKLFTYCYMKCQCVLPILCPGVDRDSTGIISPHVFRITIPLPKKRSVSLTTPISSYHYGCLPLERNGHHLLKFQDQWYSNLPLKIPTILSLLS